jgi:hypothetical protein
MPSKKASSTMTTAIADAPPLPLTLAQQKYQGVERTGAGFLLLQRMGWREGEGLVSVEFAMERESACQEN